MTRFRGIFVALVLVSLIGTAWEFFYINFVWRDFHRTSIRRRMAQSPRFKDTKQAHMKSHKDKGAIVSKSLPSERFVALTSLQNGGFIHIGKTGGSSITSVLRNACHSFVPKPCPRTTILVNETIASRKIRAYYHVPDQLLIGKAVVPHDFYLLSLRDPYDRTVSAFAYMHPRNSAALSSLRGRGRPIKRQTKKAKRAFDCFPTLEAFASFLGDGKADTRVSQSSSIPWTASDRDNEVDRHRLKCQRLAQGAIHGNETIFQHFYLNYQLVYRQLQQNGALANGNTSSITTFADTSNREGTKPSQEKYPERKQALELPTHHPILFATRQPTLWQDWKTINHLMGQAPETILVPTDTHKRQITANFSLPVSKHALSLRGRSILCRAIEPEYQAYFFFIRHSLNLNATDMASAVTYGREQCPGLRIFTNFGLEGPSQAYPAFAASKE